MRRGSLHTPLARSSGVMPKWVSEQRASLIIARGSAAVTVQPDQAVSLMESTSVAALRTAQS